MRKVFLILGGVLSLPSAGFAAFAMFQTYSGLPQITCNLTTGVASVGGPCTTPVAACNGNSQALTRNITITNSGAGLRDVEVNTATFNNPGDVGKTIVIPDAGPGGNTSVISTIASVTDSTHIVLSSNATTNPAGAAKLIGFGTDDAPSFRTFNTWARANQGSVYQVALTIPNGASCWFGTTGGVFTSGTTLTNAWAAGINNLLVEGTGATLSALGGAGFYLGAQGIIQIGLTSGSGQSARIESASSGASTLTLTAASYSGGYISRFTVGKWIMIGGLDIQGQWSFPFGFPPNNYYFEWRQVAATCNNTGACPGTATITLDRPITNSYLSTWPEYNSGSASQVDAGGPATIWALNDTWNQTVEYRGLTIKQSSQTYMTSRHVILRDVTFPNTSGIPSQNETWTAINTNWADTVEVDKLIGTMTIDGGSIPLMQFQSPTVDLFVLSNSTVTALQGGGKRSELTDVTIATLRPGALTNGNAGALICTRCAVTTLEYEGGISTSDISGGVLSMSGGVIQFANTAATGSSTAQRVFAPMPTNLFWRVGSGGSGDTIGLVRPQGITQDVTNTYIQTNEAGGFPPWTATTLFGTRSHPAPQFTCDACTGTSTLTSMNIQAGATPLAPMGSYASASFAPTSAQGSLATFPVFGQLIALTVDVSQAYSGAGAATLAVAGRFNNLSTAKQSDWTAYTWGPQVNLKQAGLRVITGSGWTCDTGGGPVAGGCLGDVDTGAGSLPESVWIRGGINPWMESVLGAGTQPQFTMTIQTDQGVVP